MIASAPSFTVDSISMRSGARSTVLVIGVATGPGNSGAETAVTIVAGLFAGTTARLGWSCATRRDGCGTDTLAEGDSDFASSSSGGAYQIEACEYCFKSFGDCGAEIAAKGGGGIRNRASA